MLLIRIQKLHVNNAYDQAQWQNTSIRSIFRWDFLSTFAQSLRRKSITVTREKKKKKTEQRKEKAQGLSETEELE